MPQFNPNDLDLQALRERRKFWEMCASRAPHEGVIAQESPRRVAEWADNHWFGKPQT